MNCNIPWINVMLGLEMLFARFMPIIGTLTIAGSLAKKGKVAESAGTCLPPTACSYSCSCSSFC